MKKGKFSLKARLNSFKCAFNGLRLLMNEHNARIHCFAGVCVVVAGIIFDISAMEWVAVTIVMGGVISAEALNTAIEQLSNHVCSEYNNNIKHTKDLAAAAVLIMTIIAAITGAIIFIPKIFTQY